MITDIIDLSSDDDSQNDSASSLPVSNNVERYSDGDDSNTDPLTPITRELNKSPITNKKKGGRKKAGCSNSDSAKRNKEERQKLKKKLAEEKQARKNANKIYKPGECMKYMTIEMHPNLLDSWYCADIQREANACGVKLKSSSSICDTALVLWTRTVMPTLQNNDGFVQLTPSKVKCEHGLYILKMEDADELVASRSLSQHLKQAVELAGCKLTLLLFGVKDYFKTSGRNARSQRLMTDIELEKAITDLLVSTDCDTVLVNTPNELALTIVQFTKAIAEEPYKKAKQALDEQADFYMRGDNKKCVAIDKDGHGLGRLWQQMLAILPHSSLETSRAICAKYKSPLELYESFQSDGVSELMSLGVSRAAVPGAKARRIGPEFARKLQALFSEEDGTVLLD